MKRILGLDLGTNSIGWALVSNSEDKKEIIGLGSRIIPMSQDILGKFEKGNTISQTAERTKLRSVRRLRERYLLRRERLHRVLGLMNFLPEHYKQYIDFEDRLGKFISDYEPKLAWRKTDSNRFEFIFKSSFEEMVNQFKSTQPQLFSKNRLIPYDWTIYYLRKKALQHKIEKEELAWVLLNFNQKRGYYKLRGEDEDQSTNERIEYHALEVVNVTADEPKKGKDEIWYSVALENGWIYRRSSKKPLFDLRGKVLELIVTTHLNGDGTIKIDKEGCEKRSFRAPSDDDWTLLKKKTEIEIDSSNKTIGCFIFDTLLKNPSQKIIGKLVRTVDRKYYKNELTAILEKQKEFHGELRDQQLFSGCIDELYPNNEAKRNTLHNFDFTRLFVEDIVFYQRPLKSKKHLISNCPYEFRSYKTEAGQINKEPIKCIAKSHPLFQEFRLWQFVHNLKIYEREKYLDGKLITDANVTKDFLTSEDDYVSLYEWLNERKEIKQDTLLSTYFKIKKNRGKDKLPFRWNYVEDKDYPCNETRHMILSRLSKLDNLPFSFYSKEIELELWHLLYSVSDRFELEKALTSFASKKGLGEDFVDTFKKFPPFPRDYGSYSEKAIKKLLPLMRMGDYWEEGAIHLRTKEKIEKIVNGEYDEDIKTKVREKVTNLTEIDHFRGLPVWLACYLVYGRHSETGDLKKWNAPKDIDQFLREEFKQHSLRNPIVEQVITETLRVIGDIWKQYGDFSEIHIELGREMKNDKKERERITKQISENENTNLRIKALLTELMNCSDVENVRPYSPSQQEILKIYEDAVLNSEAEIPDDIAKIAKMSRPGSSDLVRYKLWLEQKYRSPYTGEVIPLTRLFTPDYQIEHIIPQSRYFDDSMSNKIICEAEVNKDKDNSLGYEYIKANSGKKLELSRGKEITLFTLSEYENFVSQHYGKTRGKMKRLLMEDIPEEFIDRQLNDSRYISKVVKSLLSRIVREPDEEEAISKNIIPVTGGITAILKQEWGLNDVWNRIITPRFIRLNELTNSTKFGQWSNKDGKRVFIPEVPNEFQRGFSKKRIDHRHHALDALVIACATRSHINYLNNESAKASSKETRHDLKNKLCFKTKPDERGSYKWQFHKPWDSFTQDAQATLEKVVISFKQNLRVINKSVNYYQKMVNGEKVVVKQTKGDSWAIRKPMHKDTVAGNVNLWLKKEVTLSSAIDNWKQIVDKNLKMKIFSLKNEGLDKRRIVKFFTENDNKWAGKDVSRPELYYFSDEAEQLVASRVPLDDSFNTKKIRSITDTGIRKILLNHLSQYNESRDDKIIEHPELAFSSEGISDMNSNIVSLNGGKFHQPIYKVRTFETKGNKFAVGFTGNKKAKFVEAQKGTNLFFGVYSDQFRNRSYETFPLIIIIERLKQGLPEVPERNEEGNRCIFHLSPNDLVYVPTIEQLESGNIKSSEIDNNRIYKFVDSSGTTANFIPVSTASIILDLNKKEQGITGLKLPIQNEYGLGSPQSKSQKATTGEMIKDVCMKLRVDRLGNVSIPPHSLV